MVKKLGEIKSVDLRDIWEKEDRDFTPWLCENISILASKLGLEIIDADKEKAVGNFSLDIIGKDASTGRYVAIENQLEITDHTHLGQLITYAAGIDAGIIIWISKDIREEHKNALQWLNENSSTKLSFFGVEVYSIKIDDSPPAVDFRIVVQPNDWGRQIKSRADSMMNETNTKYMQFYSELINDYSTASTIFRKIKAQPQSWINFGSGKAGQVYGWAFRQGNRFSVELYIDNGNEMDNIDRYNYFISNKDSIESIIGDISWEELENRKACRIATYIDTSAPIKALPDDELDSLKIWGVEMMLKFQQAFDPLLKKL